MSILTALPIDASTVKGLDITVKLLDNGDALITEHWDIDITDDDAKTEWFVAYEDLGRRTITDLTVRGYVPGKAGLQPYETLQDWHINDSREEKAGKCGIYIDDEDDEDAPQICWGFGDYGRHQYEVSFRMNALVQCYDSYDGFAHSFVCMDVPIDRVTIIVTAGPALRLNDSNTRMWAFGYPGTVKWQDGNIIAESAKPLEAKKRVALMVQLNKGLLHPTIASSAHWEDVKRRAIEDGEHDDSYVNPVPIILAVSLFIVCLLIIVLENLRIFLWWLCSFQWLQRIIRRRRMGYQRKEYYTSVDREWTLVDSYYTLQALSVAPPINHTKDILKAALLRLVLAGYLIVDDDQDGQVIMRVDKSKRPTARDDGDASLMSDIADLFALDIERWKSFTPKELKENMSLHYEDAKELMEGLKGTANDDYVEENGLNLLSLKNYLRDFIAHGDLQLRHTAAMDDYLVYATLMGIGDKVYAAFRQRVKGFSELSALAKALKPGQGMKIIDNYTDSFYDGYVIGMVDSGTSSAEDGLGGDAFASGGGDFGGACGGGGR